MATAPAGDPLETNDIESIVSIRVDQIEVDEKNRLRPIDRVWAEALGTIMAREGQRSPIEVCRLPGRERWTLVTGGHRTIGAASAGIQYLKAIIVGADRQERRMREVSENLWRKGLEPIDRAAFVAELVTLHKLRAGIDPGKDGRAASAQARWQKVLKNEANDANVTMTVVYGWADEIGEQLGLSRSSIERDLLLYRRLPAGLIERLRTARHAVASNATQLRALAKLDEREQREVVGLLLAGARSVGEARATLSQKPKAAPEDKRLSAFIGAFHRMSLAEKKGALEALRPLLPAGFNLTSPGEA
jgi:ParB-like chromosome segregation protein Spo0J